MNYDCNRYECDACDHAWFDLTSYTWVCPYALLEIPILETESIHCEDEV